MARQSFGDGSQGDTVWTPAVDANGAPRRVADPSKDFIEGHLMNSKENVGKNKQNIYQIKVSPDPKVAYTGFGTEGKLIDIWGCTVLDDQMANFMKSPIGGLGAWVRIEFSGRDVKKEAKAKAEGALQASDLTIKYTVIGDDEIPAIKVDGQKAYTPNATNQAPTPTPKAEAKAPVAAQEVPATIDDEGEESEELPF